MKRPSKRDRRKSDLRPRISGAQRLASTADFQHKLPAGGIFISWAEWEAPMNCYGLHFNMSMCAVPSGCLPGWFGVGCLQRCKCSNGAMCDAATGNCTCGLGWMGAHCDEGDPIFFIAFFMLLFVHMQMLRLVRSDYVDLAWFICLFFPSFRMSCGQIWCQLPAEMWLSQ